MEKEIDLLVKKYLSKDIKIEYINEIFLKVINTYEKKLSKINNKKTKKNKKKICRPVLLISDSSCDEFLT